MATTSFQSFSLARLKPIRSALSWTLTARMLRKRSKGWMPLQAMGVGINTKVDNKKNRPENILLGVSNSSRLRRGLAKRFLRSPLRFFFSRLFIPKIVQRTWDFEGVDDSALRRLDTFEGDYVVAIFWARNNSKFRSRSFVRLKHRRKFANCRASLPELPQTISSASLARPYVFKGGQLFTIVKKLVEGDYSARASFSRVSMDGTV